MRLEALGYVGIHAKTLDDWATYGTRFLGMQVEQGPRADPGSGLLPTPFTIKDSARSPPLPGLTGRSIAMDERLCRSVRRSGPTSGAALWLGDTAMPSADEVLACRVRDKLTIAEVCADLGISRRTFYEWRAKGRAPRCITLPNGSLRVRRAEYHRWLAAREEAA